MKTPACVKTAYIRNIFIALISTFLTDQASYAQSVEEYNIREIEKLTPLSEYLERPSSEIIPEYAFLRCSGLFLGTKYYTGATFDEQTAATNDAHIETLRKAGALIRLTTIEKRTGAASSKNQMSQIIKDTWGEINSFAFFYDDRMKENFLRDGAAYSEDPLISGDLSSCGEVAQAAFLILANTPQSQ